MPTRRLSEFSKNNARRLRVQMTEAEARLWFYLRNRSLGGAKFKRQHPFKPYFLDFYCAEARLVVEVDGSQHYEPDRASRDAERTAFLAEHGIRVLRFNNREVLLETDGVLSVILEALGDPSP